MTIDFGSALFLLPIATALHVRDEWPSFPRWARRFGSPLYSDREYAAIHAIAIGISLASPVVFAAFPDRLTAFLLVALVIAPNLICNSLFHIGASIASRTACPGVITATFVYLPLAGVLLALALREHWLSTAGLYASMAVAGLLHTAEVGHNVFKRW